MKNQKILYFILLSTILAWAGCSKDDYWKMSDPSLVVIDSTEKTYIFNNPKAFNVENTTLNYGSHLKFSNINKDVTFDISTKCLLNNKVFTSNHTQQVIYQKLFFYNFIPLQTIATASDIENQEFQCDIHIVAKNSIDSKITYDLSNLTFNTIKSHKIYIGNADKDAPALNNGYISNHFIDATNTANKEISAVIAESDKIFDDAQIICKDNIFKKSDRIFGIKEFSINQFFQDLNSNTFFYKKCRVISFTAPFVGNSNKSMTDIDYERFWSPYFDIIIHKPKLSIRAEFVNASDTYFTDNNQSYSFIFAKLTLKNDSYVPAFIKLKDTTEAQISIAYRGYTQRTNKSAIGILNISLQQKELPDELLKGSLRTQLKFVPESVEQDKLIDLSTTRKSPTLFLQLEKNFSCSIHNQKETGLWLKAIRPYSKEDEIEVYVSVNGELQKFPMPYYISEILEPSSLNMMNDSKYLFDGLLLPKLRSTSFKNAENHDFVYKRKISSGIDNALIGSMDKYYSILRKTAHYGNFCRTYPSDSSVTN